MKIIKKVKYLFKNKKYLRIKNVKKTKILNIYF